MIRLVNGMTEEADRDLERRVVSLLLGRQLPALRRVAVQAREGCVTLRGRVASFYEKQMALSCCRSVDGVVSVDDQVAVSPYSVAR